MLRDRKACGHAREHDLLPVSGVCQNLGRAKRHEPLNPRGKQMRSVQRGILWGAIIVATCAVAFAQTPAPQAPPAGGRGPAPRLVLSVTSPGWPDGGEVPMHHAGRGDNK